MCEAGPKALAGVIQVPHMDSSRHLGFLEEVYEL